MHVYDLWSHRYGLLYIVRSYSLEHKQSSLSPATYRSLSSPPPWQGKMVFLIPHVGPSPTPLPSPSLPHSPTLCNICLCPGQSKHQLFLLIRLVSLNVYKLSIIWLQTLTDHQESLNFVSLSLSVCACVCERQKPWIQVCLNLSVSVCVIIRDEVSLSESR